MLDHEEAVQRLIQVSPDLYERLIDYWKEISDKSTAIGDFCVLAQYVHDALSYDWSIDLPEILCLIEQFLDQGNEEVRAASGRFLQELLEREIQPEAWTPHLGARSRELVRASDERLGRWTPGLYPDLESGL